MNPAKRRCHVFDQRLSLLLLHHQRSDEFGRRDRVLRQRPLRSGKPDRSTERRSQLAAGAGRQPALELGLHGDDLPGLEPESLVRSVAAGATGAMGGKTPTRETNGVEDGVQDILECVCPHSVPDCAHGTLLGLPPPGLESVATRLLATVRRLEMLTIEDR